MQKINFKIRTLLNTYFRLEFDLASIILNLGRFDGLVEFTIYPLCMANQAPDFNTSISSHFIGQSVPYSVQSFYWWMIINFQVSWIQNHSSTQKCQISFSDHNCISWTDSDGKCRFWPCWVVPRVKVGMLGRQNESNLTKIGWLSTLYWFAFLSAECVIKSNCYFFI